MRTRIAKVSTSSKGFTVYANKEIAPSPSSPYNIPQIPLLYDWPQSNATSYGATIKVNLKIIFLLYFSCLTKQITNMSYPLRSIYSVAKGGKDVFFFFFGCDVTGVTIDRLIAWTQVESEHVILRPANQPGCWRISKFKPYTVPRVLHISVRVPGL